MTAWLGNCFYFYDADGFIEIGFVRRIFADFAHPTHPVKLGYTAA
jgi:hypothetical protein